MPQKNPHSRPEHCPHNPSWGKVTDHGFDSILYLAISEIKQYLSADTMERVPLVRVCYFGSPVCQIRRYDPEQDPSLTQMRRLHPALIAPISELRGEILQVSSRGHDTVITHYQRPIAVLEPHPDFVALETNMKMLLDAYLVPSPGHYVNASALVRVYNRLFDAHISIDVLTRTFRKLNQPWSFTSAYGGQARLILLNYDLARNAHTRRFSTRITKGQSLSDLFRSLCHRVEPHHALAALHAELEHRWGARYRRRQRRCVTAIAQRIMATEQPFSTLRE